MGYLIKRIELAGYKSIGMEGQAIDFGATTLLIGANGAGKSNLVSFFRLLSYLTTGALQTYIAQNGFADSLLFFGAKETPICKASLEFEDSETHDTLHYDFTLANATQGSMIFTNESLSWQRSGESTPMKIDLGSGHRESALLTKCEEDSKAGKTAQFALNALQACRVYQFHDTTPEAKIRTTGYINDNAYLRANAGNLAAYLLQLQNSPGGVFHYNRIVRFIRLAMPQFLDFALAPMPSNPNYTILDWKAKNSDYLFGPHQLSDGSLRFMALCALLLGPPSKATGAIVIDEPELGLHPAAIADLAAMVREANRHCKIVLATQSTTLLDEFDPADVVVVELDAQRQATQYRRLDQESLSRWLTEYSMGELWERNVLGGQPVSV